VARIGGDEFIVLAGGIADTEVLKHLGETLLTDLNGNAYVDGHKLELRASLGAALYPQDGRNLDSLMKSSDLKMYQDKQRGKVYRLDQHRS